jgi:hypothetical protein
MHLINLLIHLNIHHHAIVTLHLFPAYSLWATLSLYLQVGQLCAERSDLLWLHNLLVILIAGDKASLWVCSIAKNLLLVLWVLTKTSIIREMHIWNFGRAKLSRVLSLQSLLCLRMVISSMFLLIRLFWALVTHGHALSDAIEIASWHILILVLKREVQKVIALLHFGLSNIRVHLFLKWTSSLDVVVWFKRRSVLEPLLFELGLRSLWTLLRPVEWRLLAVCL